MLRSRPIRTDTHENLSGDMRHERLEIHESPPILGSLGLLVLTITSSAPARPKSRGAPSTSPAPRSAPSIARSSPSRTGAATAFVSSRSDAQVQTARRNGDHPDAQATIETRDGAVESLDTRILASGQELHIFGTAKNGQMFLTIEGTASPSR